MLYPCRIEVGSRSNHDNHTYCYIWWVLTTCQALHEQVLDTNTLITHHLTTETLKLSDVEWLSQGHTAREWKSPNSDCLQDWDLVTAPTQISTALIWLEGNEPALTGQQWGSNEKTTLFRAWHVVGGHPKLSFPSSCHELTQGVSLNRISNGLRGGQKQWKFLEYERKGKPGGKFQWNHSTVVRHKYLLHVWGQELANFYRGPDIKYFRFCRPGGLSHNYSTLL